jgi:hypothetical protein
MFAYRDEEKLSVSLCVFRAPLQWHYHQLLVLMDLPII